MKFSALCLALFIEVCKSSNSAFPPAYSGCPAESKRPVESYISKTFPLILRKFHLEIVLVQI